MIIPKGLSGEHWGRSFAMQSWTLLAAMLVAGTLLPLPFAWGQQTTGTISGTISDESGAVMPGVRVTVTNTGTGIGRTMTTDGRGYYTAPLLPVGTYQVRSELPGFQAVVQTGILLAVGQEAIVNVRMRVGEVTQTVEVTGETPLVETTSTALGGVVEEQRIMNLPLNGRNYTELLYLEPGVQRSVQKSTDGGFHGDMTSVNGAPVRSLAYLVDGAYINDGYGMAVGSVAGSSLGVDAVREFRITTSTYSAEYGRNMAGVINVVTKSGTNEFHGTLFHVLRNDNLDARNTFDIPRKQEFKRNQFGGSLGGPIRRDKTFFFATYEGLRERLGQSQVSFVPTAAARVDGGLVPTVAPAVKPFLRFWPLPPPGTPESRPGSGVAQITLPFTQPTTENYGQGRLDHTFGSNDSVFVRYTADPTERTVASGFPTDVFPTFLTSRNQFAVLNYLKILTPTLINTAKFAFARTEALTTGPFMNDPALNFLPGVPWGRVLVPGVQTIGQDYISPFRVLRNLYDFSDGMVLTKGRHATKFGFQFGHFQDSTIDSFFLRGDWIFADLRSFLGGRPQLGLIVLPPGVTPTSRGQLDRYYDYNVIGTYLQDDIRVRPNFTLNLGLRYEFQTVPEEKYGRVSALVNPLTDSAYTEGKFFKNPSLRNFSPRVGFAWDPFSNGKTVVRGGFALMQDLGTLTTSYVIAVDTPPFASVAAVFTGLTTFPLMDLSQVASGPPSVFAIDYDVDQPHLFNYNFNVQQELPGRMVLRAGYVGTRGYDLMYWREGNPVLPDGEVNGRPFWSRPFLPRRNPNLADCTCMGGFSESWYNALQLSVQKSLSHGLQFQSAYTWSKALDLSQGQSGGSEGNDSGFANPLDPRADRGLADFDARHNWVSNILYDLPFGQNRWWGGWRLGSLLTVSAGNPFSAKLAQGISRQSNRGGRGCCERAELKPGADAQSVVRTGQRQYLDPVALVNAFAPAQPGLIGNSGRNILVGPGLVTIDFSISKQFPLQFWGEGKNLEFRAEAFNLPNRVNYRNPNPTVFAGISPTDPVLPNGGVITRTKTSSRQLQFGLRLSF